MAHQNLRLGKILETVLSHLKDDFQSVLRCLRT